MVFQNSKKINKKQPALEKQFFFGTKLKTSDELFATSTAGGIMPITKINGKPVGSGVPGKITRELHKTYWNKHFDPNWSLSVDDILIKWKIFIYGIK